MATRGCRRDCVGHLRSAGHPQSGTGCEHAAAHNLGSNGANRIATATLLEVRMVVLSQLNEAGLAELELLLNRAQIQVVSFNADHMR